MNTGIARLAVLLLAASVLEACVATRHAAKVGGNTAARASCPPADIALDPEPPVLEMFRVYTGDDGLSHGESLPLQGSTTRYLGMVLHQYSLGDPSEVVIVNGPPNFRIPRHAAPYREIFLTLRGSVTMELSDGTRHELRPGSLLMFEDTRGPGHGGLVGPCGYTSLDLQFKPPPPR